MNELLILVDENDSPTGTMEKLEAHRKGLLHRAISVFIFNSGGEALLQKRSSEKYHSPGLWTNTCCSHPKPGEDTKEAAHRRLMEEMGMRAELHYAFPFQYKAVFGNGLTEHEYDHVFYAVSDDVPAPDSDEVEEWKYMAPTLLLDDIQSHPELYTEWFKLCFNRLFIHAQAFPVSATQTYR